MVPRNLLPPHTTDMAPRLLPGPHWNVYRRRWTQPLPIYSPPRQGVLLHLPLVPYEQQSHSIVNPCPVQAESSFLRTGVFQLSEIPPEIRVKIYREYFMEISKDITHTQRQYPNLLAAARGQPLLYQEILELYHRCYNFRLWTLNELNFSNDVSMELLRSMQHLTLEYGGEYAMSPSVSQERRRAFAYDFYVWHEPVNTKIHQALNLRTLLVSVHIQEGTATSNVLDLVDLIFLYFPVLEKFTVYTTSTRDSSPGRRTLLSDPGIFSLDPVMEELIKKKEVRIMETYNEGLEDDITGTGFECHWLGKDGKEKCFVTEERTMSDAARILGEAEQKLWVQRSGFVRNASNGLESNAGLAQQ